MDFRALNINKTIPLLNSTALGLTDCQNGTVDVSACKYLHEEAYAKYRKHEITEGDLIVGVQLFYDRDQAITASRFLVPHR